MSDRTSRWQAATIERIDRLNGRIRRLVLRPSTWRLPVPGQHLDLRLTAPDGYQAQRKYSLLSARSGSEHWELAVEHLPGGEVSPHLHEVAAVGDRLDVAGPFGRHFVWQGDEPEPVLLIGGGSGAVPLLAMAERHRHSRSAAPMLLVCAAARREDLLLAAELRAWAQADPSLSVRFALSREPDVLAPDEWPGRIDAQRMSQALDDLGAVPGLCFVAGRNAFVESMTGWLQRAGVPGAVIRTERFGG